MTVANLRILCIMGHVKENTAMKVGDRIRAKRQDLGMSVDELAARLGKNRATMYRYEKGDIENMPVNAATANPLWM